MDIKNLFDRIGAFGSDNFSIKSFKAESVPYLKQAPNGIKLRHISQVYEYNFGRVAWSPKSELLALGVGNSTCVIYDAKSGKIQKILRGHKVKVFDVAWSPDGQLLASCSADNTAAIWDIKKGVILFTFYNHYQSVLCVDWSPDGKMLATGSSDNSILIWDAEAGKVLKSLLGHTGYIYSVKWSSDGKTLISSSSDRTIRLWETASGNQLRKFTGHNGKVYDVVWSPDERIIVSASSDKTIRVWDPMTGKAISILHGHTDNVNCLSFFLDGAILASKSLDNTIRFWYCENWETIGQLKDTSTHSWYPGFAFHPKKPIMATLDEKNRLIRVWDVDLDILLAGASVSPSVHYTNAKVVLVGHTGTGKTCLARALMGKAFIPQESTHGMKVWSFLSKSVKRRDGGKTTREILLWDLAGQSDYQVIHQLFLEKTALGVILFDPTSHDNPYRGVGHWEKALRKIASENSLKILVAGRVDRGYPTVTIEDIKLFCHNNDFEDFFETSTSFP